MESAEEYRPHRALLQGMRQLRSGQVEQAAAAFEAASRHPDTRAWAYTATGEALYRMRRLSEACRVLQIALTFDPDQIEAHRWLSAAYYDLGAMDLALKHLQRVGELDPDDARAPRMRGLILKDYELYSRAANEYEAALKRRPQKELEEAIRRELAHCLVELRRYDEALAHLDRCRPTPDVLVLRAKARLGLGAADQAEALVRQALQSEPDNREALILAATLALQEGRTGEALETLQRACRKYPRDYLIRLKLAQAHQAAGNDAEAAEHMREMERLRDLRARFTELHQQALNDTTDADLRFRLGRLAVQLGKRDLARSWFTMALSLDPSHRRAQAALKALSPAVSTEPSGPKSGPAPAVQSPSDPSGR